MLGIATTMVAKPVVELPERHTHKPQQPLLFTGVRVAAVLARPVL